MADINRTFIAGNAITLDDGTLVDVEPRARDVDMHHSLVFAAPDKLRPLIQAAEKTLAGQAITSRKIVQHAEKTIHEGHIASKYAAYGHDHPIPAPEVLYVEAARQIAFYDPKDLAIIEELLKQGAKEIPLVVNSEQAQALHKAVGGAKPPITIEPMSAEQRLKHAMERNGMAGTRDTTPPTPSSPEDRVAASTAKLRASLDSTRPSAPNTRQAYRHTPA